MNRQSVRSSNLNNVGYEKDTHMLEVEFNNGSVYRYHDVPESTYVGLVGSPSPGRTLKSIVAQYSFERVS